MSSGVNWRVVLFWTKIGVASIGTSLFLVDDSFVSFRITMDFESDFCSVSCDPCCHHSYSWIPKCVAFTASCCISPLFKTNDAESVECDIPLFYILSDP